MTDTVGFPDPTGSHPLTTPHDDAVAADEARRAFARRLAADSIGRGRRWRAWFTK